MTLETHFTSAFTMSYFAIVKLNQENSSSSCSGALCIYLAPWLVGLWVLSMIRWESVGQVTWLIQKSDQITRIHSVLRAGGKINNGDLVDGVNAGEQPGAQRGEQVPQSSGFIGCHSSLPRLFILAPSGSQHLGHTRTKTSGKSKNVLNQLIVWSTGCQLI